MTEQHIRCRFYPHCAMHLGEPRPRHFSAENFTEMRALRVTGWQLDEIAEAFGTTANSITNILKGPRKRDSAR